jgi:capsular exopolysaccharide synthesis family protein
MTTLPQTTTMRYPRPATGVPALPAPAGALMQSGGAAAAGMTMSDVIRVLRTNLWLLIVAMILGVGVGGGSYYYLGKYYSEFTARGFVQVKPTGVWDPLSTVRTGAAPDVNLAVEQKTAAAGLRSEALWSQVLQDKDSPIQQTKWIQQFRRESANADGTVSNSTDVAAAKRDLDRNFGVYPRAETRIIEVTMSCTDPKDARDIVSVIVNKHIDNLVRNKRLDNDNEIASRSRLKSFFTRELQSRQDQLNAKLAELGGDGSGAGFNGLTVAQMNLQQLMVEQLKAQSAYNNAKASFEAVKGQIDQGVTPSRVDDIANNDPSVLRLKSIVDDTDVRLRTTAAKMGENHRETESLRAEKQLWQNKLDERLREVRAAQQAALFDALASGVQASKEEFEQISGQVDQKRKEMDARSRAIVEYLTIKSDLDDLRMQIKELDASLNTLNTAASTQMQGGIEWYQSPDTPDTRSFPKLPVILGTSLFGFMGLALGIAFLREIMDTSVRSPRDIARVGQMNLLGMIPHEDDDPQAQAGPLSLVISRAPHSIIAEQFRQVRTRLQHAASLETTRSLLVTSPGPGDGKSTVAANIAAGLALNGRRILLVDANFRRPEIHKIFNVANTAGLGSILTGQSGVDAALVKSDIPNLDLLPAGPRPENATELLEGQALNEFIDRALEEYDHVIFDSGPLLFVSETVALAPRVDGVITVVRARNNSRGLLGRMRDQLRQLKAEHLGVILNAVRGQAGGYYSRNIKTYYAYQNAD